jgi:hypothetical protein
VVTVVQAVPPSVVTTTTPVTWSASTAMLPVTQQSVEPVHETAVAPDTAVGRGPTWVQAADDESDDSATAPPIVDPMARQVRSGRQVTAVTSRMPAGTGFSAHVEPPSAVSMVTACPLDVWVAWPTAVQWRRSLQAIRDRYPTSGGMTSGDHVDPPLTVAMTAAPLGASAPPTVDPTAQHRSAVAQATSVRELTGAGGDTAENPPSQGESDPKVETVEVPLDPGELQDATVISTATTATTMTALRRSG